MNLIPVSALITFQAQQQADGSSSAKQIKLDNIFPAVAPMKPDNPRSVQITKAITRMIAMDFQPYSVVENRGFRELIQVLEPKYQIPPRTTFSRNLVPDMYKNVVKSIKHTLADDITPKRQGGLLSEGVGSSCAAPAFSFTTDIWTSRAMDPYISFTVSYVTDQFRLKSFALENKHFPGSHTADRVLEELENCMEQWGLPTQIPIFCVRDNGSNIKAAVRNSVWVDVACFAHTLQLAISDAIQAEEGMENMLKNASILYHITTTVLLQVGESTSINATTI